MTAPLPGRAASSADGPRFAVVGAYVIDCITRTDRMPDWGETHEGESVHMAPGGKALNMAVALARMGAHVDAIGVVGDDLAGHTVVDALVREGVDIEALEVRPGARTPICVCFSRNTDGETAFLWRIDDSVAMDASTIHGAGRAPLEAADATIVTFESPAAVGGAITLAKSEGGLVVLHPAPTSPAVDLNTVPWKDVDVMVPNCREARALLDALDSRVDDEGRLASALAGTTGVDAVVVTLGGDGVLLHSCGRSDRLGAPVSGRVVDTMGASDAFTATLTQGLTLGLHVDIAVQKAQESAADTLASFGAFGAVPTFRS